MADATSATAERSCYICLQTESDDPDAIIVSGCPCSLEAHEPCLLRWVAEEETRGQRNIVCPVCQAPIKVMEPRDRTVQLRDRLHLVYSRITPAVCLGVFATGTLVAMETYGFFMVTLFVGTNRMKQWLPSLLDTCSSRDFTIWQQKATLSEQLVKRMALVALGPGILIWRAVPGPTEKLASTLALARGLYLVAGERELPTWPPSGQWVLALMPLVSWTYSRIYNTCAGPFEKRLNRALRGLDPTEDPQALQQQPAEAAPHVGNQNDQADGGQGAAEDGGLWANFLALYRAFFTQEGGMELNLRIENHVEMVEEELDDEDDHEDEQDLDDADEPDDDALPDLMPGSEAQAFEADEPSQPNPDAAQVPAAPAPDNANQNRDNQDRNDRDGNNRDGNNRNAREAGGAVTEVINSLVTSLLYPVISVGVGEVLRVALPKSFTRPTSIQQHRWGRSLMGGYLFIVLKDVWRLYYKYRKVQVKRHRKIQTVEKRLVSQ